jgi:hypothetical protein
VTLFPPENDVYVHAPCSYTISTFLLPLSSEKCGGFQKNDSAACASRAHRAKFTCGTSISLLRSGTAQLSPELFSFVKGVIQCFRLNWYRFRVRTRLGLIGTSCPQKLRRVAPESCSLGGFVDTQNLVALHIMKDLPDAAWPSDTYFFDGRLMAQPEMHSLVPRR